MGGLGGVWSVVVAVLRIWLGPWISPLAQRFHIGPRKLANRGHYRRLFAISGGKKRGPGNSRWWGKPFQNLQSQWDCLGMDCGRIAVGQGAFEVGEGVSAVRPHLIV